ncbi:MAG: response regulator [Planctomycetales bacterium]|nr:response regulator [Planctomycetales bacterium]
MRKVLGVGNCAIDHGNIRQMLQEHFAAELDAVHDGTSALDALRANDYDLVLVNRLLDRDGSSGLDVIKSIRTASEFALVPVMMVTNFSDHQAQAVAAGAVPGFGKAALGTAETLACLQPFLAEDA